MGVIPRLHSEIEFLNRRYGCASSSMKRRIINDYEYAYELAEQLGIKLDIPKYTVNLDKESLFCNQIEEYIFDMEKIADVVIGMFKEMDFYYFKRLGNFNISKKELENLMNEFFEYFSNDLLYLYRDLVKNDCLLIHDLGDNLGESFLLNYVGSYYMALSQNNKNGLLLFETIVHELLHIYSFMFLKNYRYTGTQNLNDGFFGETVSLYGELSLFEFLKSKKIYGVDLDIQRNLIDYYILCYFKTVKYLAEMMKRPDTRLWTNNVEYEIFGNNLLEVDEHLPMFLYPESFKKGSILDCRYAMSSIEAFRLLEKEKSGIDPKVLINEYLLTFQNDGQMDEFLSGYIDLDFMYQTIGERNMELKKRYFR